MPLECRNSKPKCAAAAASGGIVWNLISWGCVGWWGEPAWRCGVGAAPCPQLSPSPSQSLVPSGCFWPTASSDQGLSYREEQLHQTLYLHIHNHCWVQPGWGTVTAVTQAMSCCFYPDMCFTLLCLSPHTWTARLQLDKPPAKPIKIFFWPGKLGMFLYLLPSPALLPSLLPPFFFFFVDISLNFVFSHAFLRNYLNCNNRPGETLHEQGGNFPPSPWALARLEVCGSELEHLLT